MLNINFLYVYEKYVRREKNGRGFGLILDKNKWKFGSGYWQRLERAVVKPDLKQFSKAIISGNVITSEKKKKCSWFEVVFQIQSKRNCLIVKIQQNPNSRQDKLIIKTL